MDPLGEAVLGLDARGVQHSMLSLWLATPNATFGVHRPCDAWRMHPAIVEDVARLAVERDFRAGC